MTTQEVKRKLTAILIADVKGYSRLMGEDEEWTVHTLNTYKDMMRGLIQQYRGRIVDAPGDNVLAEFASVVDAVQWTVGIQQVLRAKNAMLPENRRMEFRIGINLGDVIEEGEQIYGDGVNIAARLEGLAEAGGICISGSAKKKKVIIKKFKESFFPYIGEEVKYFFEKLKQRISPDIIFTHYCNDLHQDHRLISELTWNTYRDHFILEYEIIKYDGDIGVPNLFVHLDESTCQKKIDLIMDCFKSQKNRDWFTSDAFLSVLRIRGIECRAPEKYAEGFYCRKLVF